MLVCSKVGIIVEVSMRGVGIISCFLKNLYFFLGFWKIKKILIFKGIYFGLRNVKGGRVFLY